MNTIQALRRDAGLTQSELARRGGTSQPTIAAYEAGTKSPTLRTVAQLARGAGLQAVVEFHPPLTREDRRSLALHEAIARALVRDPDGVRARARRALERMREVVAPGSHVLREWAVLLDRPTEALCAILVDPSPWARELRHVTPFAGVLSAGERREAMEAFAVSEEERHEP